MTIRYLMLMIMALMGTLPAQAQVIYISSQSYDIYRLNMDACTTDHVVKVSQVIWDISFDPHGNLYGISNRGDLYLIDTITGDVHEVHQFSGQQFNSLTIAATGIIYTIGDEGELWSYNPTTDQADFLGSIDYGATGDLTFYRGELYVAADGDRIIQINLDEPSASNVIINDNIQGNVLGIVSNFVSCHEINVYAITGGLSDIYQIDFESNQLNLVCELNLSVYGGASTTEFLSSSSFTITDATTLDPNCKDEGGTIEITTQGGTGNLTFSINGSPFQAANSFDSLSAGEYEVIAQDEIGCRDTTTVHLAVTAGPKIDTVVTTPSSCRMNNGSLEVFASGGTEPYLFSIDSFDFQFTGLFDATASGRYSVVVVDAAGCVVWDEAVVDSLQVAGILSTAVAHTTCNEHNGSILVLTDTQADVTYSLNGKPFTPANEFLALPAGDHTITLQDSNGCTDAITVHINGSDIPALEVLELTPAFCNQQNGKIAVAGKHGIKPYEFTIDGVDFTTSGLFTSLKAGSYTVHIQDSNGCINAVSVAIPNEPGILLTSLITTPTDCGEPSGGVVFEFIDETLPVHLWLNHEPIQIGSEINSLASGEYFLSLIDAAGCRADTSFTITRTGCPLYIPNVFSPNSDGVNDFFRIYGADEEQATINRFYVFDRWGNNVYARFNFDIHEETGWWDGMFKRFVMDPGVFAYYIEVEFEDGESAVFKGDVTLIR